MEAVREDRETMFAALTAPTSVALFFDRVADDVDWTIEGTHPLAGRYTDKKSLLTDALGRLRRLATGDVRLEVTGLVVDGHTVVAELRSTAEGLDETTYDNRLCWVCQFASAEPGAVIVEVREYLDSAMMVQMIADNERISTS